MTSSRTPTWPSRYGGYEVAADADAPGPIQREIGRRGDPSRIEETGDNLWLEKASLILVDCLVVSETNRYREGQE